MFLSRASTITVASARRVVGSRSSWLYGSRSFFTASSFRGFPVKSVEVQSLVSNDDMVTTTASSGALSKILAPIGTHVKAGDTVAMVGDVYPIPSPQAGTVVGIQAQIGDTIRVGDVLFKIDTDSEDIAASLLDRLRYQLDGNHGKLDVEGALWKTEILEDLQDIQALHDIAFFLSGSNVMDLRPKALAIYSRILQLHQEQKSPTSMVATTALRLGTLLHALGDSDAAEQHLTHAVKLHQKSSHPDTLRAQLQLATVYGDTDQVPKAVEVLESALEDTTRSPDIVAEISAMLANLHHRQGSFDNALEQYQKALNFYSNEDVKDDSKRASVHHAMGLVQAQTTSTALASGQLDQASMTAGFEGALASFQKSLDLRLAESSTSSSVQSLVATSHMAVAQVLADALGRDLDEASQHVQSAINIWQQSSSTDSDANSPRIAAGYNHLGAIAYQQQEYKRAVDYYRNALSVLEDTLGAKDENHPDLAAAHNNIGLALMQSGDTEEARKEHQIGLKILEKQQNQDPNRMAVTLGSLGNVCKAREEFEDALDFYQRAHTLLTSDESSSKLDIASSHNNQGAVLVELGRLDDALAEYRNARDVFAANLGESHAHTASCHYNLGLVWHLKQEFQKAALEYELARNLWADALGSEHSQVQVANQAIEAAKQDMANEEKKG